MLARIRGDVRFKEPLNFHTSLRIGGPAEFFIMPQDLDDVRHALAFADQEDLPLMVIGGGNNLLVPERGVDAVVLKLGGLFARVQFHGDEAAVGAGVLLSELIREAAAQDLGGLEHLAGIPASVGGALESQTGTREGSLSDACSAVYFLYRDGTLGEWRPRHQGLGTHAFELPEDAIVVGCRMRLERRPAPAIHKAVQQRLRQRRASRPFALACVGYVWKDPAGDRAERLLDAAGLRCKRVGGAEISTKCSNLIVNRGEAGAGDVLALMDLSRERIRAQFGITLEPRIRLIGRDGAERHHTESLELATSR